MKHFLVKITTFCLPLFILAIIYIITDVFKVIYHYDPYYTGSYYIGVNRAYGSTMTYINQNPKYHYDSFIFGNSRSLFYEIDTWKKYLPKESVCMHFDESGGSISGVRDKVAFIDKNGGKLKNALLVIDHNLLSIIEQKNGYLFIAPPILKDYKNIIDFHWQHFLAFLNPTFIVALADYNMFGTFRPYMKNLISDRHSTYIPEYNEFQKTLTENEISKGIYYDAAHMKAFEDKQKPGTYSSEKLDIEEIKCLREIKELFDKHKTSYKIVISPLYDQIKLNRSVYNTLCSIFGKNHIYDFSGVNKWNKDFHNYYEDSHYRPIVSAEIMDIIYSK
jgi:hypothetical protein